MEATAGHLERAVIKLDIGAVQRVGDALLGAAAAITWYLLGGFFVGLVLKTSDARASAVAWLVAAALAVGVFALGRWGRRRLRSALNLDTRLIVQADCLVIRHGPLLAAPAVIPKEAVGVVAFDRSARASSRHSLAVEAESGRRRLTWLWERYSLPPVPVLGLPTRAPNLALLFNRPIEVGSVDAETAAGLLLRVRDPAGAERAFANWAACRPVTGDDLARARLIAGRPD
jgi:hypothetical protein